MSTVWHLPLPSDMAFEQELSSVFGDLAVLTRALQLLLHLGNLRLERRDFLRELVDGRGQVRDLRVEPVDVTRLQLLRTCKTALE